MMERKNIKLKVINLALLSNYGCDRLNLERATAQDVLAAAQEEKGKRAVMINVWATW